LTTQDLTSTISQRFRTIRCFFYLSSLLHRFVFFNVDEPFFLILSSIPLLLRQTLLPLPHPQPFPLQPLHVKQLLVVFHAHGHRPETIVNDPEPALLVVRLRIVVRLQIVVRLRIVIRLLIVVCPETIESRPRLGRLEIRLYDSL
jgi:hypothetical protein